jgi:DMSO/TMAO reductase YedYZ molybdopterin-dependent catalytic subunit
MIIRKNPKIRFPNPNPARVPPGQFVTTQWPVLHAGGVPRIDLANWSFEVTGEVENPLRLTWDEFQKLPRAPRRNDVHCVTHWTRLDNDWEGVPVREVLRLARPTPEARFVIEHAVGGWTTNVPLADFDRDENLFATHHGGKPLTPEHGWPMRVVIPHLYFWKGAKWCNGHRADSRRTGGLLGGPGLPHARRPLDGGAVPGVAAPPPARLSETPRRRTAFAIAS